MGAQDNTEKVLRSLHVLLSKSETYPKEPSKVIVDKQQVLDLLAQLNDCIYQIMDEYELTRSSRDKAEREFQKHGDEIIWDASRKAEDVYAASVLYMDDALNRMQEIMKDASEKVSTIYSQVDEQMKKETRAIKSNQLELKSQLQDLVDTEKYLKIIEDRNREMEKEKNEGKPLEEREPNLYADRQTEIKVNQEYLDKLGLSVVDETEKEIAAGDREQTDDDEELKELEAEVRVNLDADYFKWKEEQTEENNDKGKKSARDGLQKKIKNLIGGHQYDDTGM